jgi:hypothetical protein
LHGVQGVASSNPAAPTKTTKGFPVTSWKPFFFGFCSRGTARGTGDESKQVGVTVRGASR